MRVYVSVCVFVCVCVCVSICARVCMYMCMYLRLRIHMVEELKILLKPEGDLCSGSGDGVIGAHIRGVRPVPATTMLRLHCM